MPPTAGCVLQPPEPTDPGKTRDIKSHRSLTNRETAFESLKKCTSSYSDQRSEEVETWWTCLSFLYHSVFSGSTSSRWINTNIWVRTSRGASGCHEETQINSCSGYIFFFCGFTHGALKASIWTHIAALSSSTMLSRWFRMGHFYVFSAINLISTTHLVSFFCLHGGPFTPIKARRLSLPRHLSGPCPYFESSDTLQTVEERWLFVCLSRLSYVDICHRSESRCSNMWKINHLYIVDM